MKFCTIYLLTRKNSTIKMYNKKRLKNCIKWKIFLLQNTSKIYFITNIFTSHSYTQRKFSILLSCNIPKHNEISVFSSYYKDKSVSIELHQCNASQPKCAYIGCVWCIGQSYRSAFINRRLELFEEFQTMKGTRNVTAAQIASGEAVQDARSFLFFFFFIFGYACSYIFLDARAFD